jgi:hypothetical protein
MSDLEQDRRDLVAFVNEVYEAGHIARIDRDMRLARIDGAADSAGLALELAELKRILAGQGTMPVTGPSGSSGYEEPLDQQLVKVHHGSLDRRKAPWLERDRVKLDLAHASAHISLLEMGEDGRLEDIELELDAAHSSIHLIVHEGTRIIDELEKEGSNMGMNGRLKRSMGDSFYTIRLRGSIRYSNLYFQAK